jgi:pimeloyl-ACP methyl ester carboxylesterase
MMVWYRRTLLLWSSVLSVAAGCASFQTGPSQPLAETERVMTASRGQLRIIERNPQGAETVLLVHGYGASSASWVPILPLLAQRFHVIAVDLPGFGLSDKREGDYSPDALADVLAEVLDHKNVRRAHVVGHSWGSSVVLAFARRHRDRLGKMAIVSGWMYDEQIFPLMRWARSPGGGGFYALFYRQGVGERMYLNFYDPSRLSQEVVDEVERSMKRPGALAAAVAAARAMKFSEHEAEYPKIDADTLVLWGRQDRVARLAFGERLARDLPRARLVVIDRCGHIPMWECTGEAGLALKGFLEEPAR